MKVLLVDDDVLVRNGLAAVLMARGYRVWTAGTAEEALRRTADLDPDVVVTDLRMPDMDGLALLERLEGRPQPPCRVVYTASAPPPGAAASGWGEGPTWVQKTMDHRGLLEVLEAMRESGEGRDD